MIIQRLYSKLHRLCVTHTDLHYEGSAGFDADLLAAARLQPGQQVDIVNAANGERFTTYVIAEAAGSGRAAIYGAAARKVAVGDVIIVMAYAGMTPEEAAAFVPAIVQVDANNAVRLT